MKVRDFILFGFPVTAILLILAFILFLYHQIGSFENIYVDETKKNIARNVAFISTVMTPLLNEGKTDEAIKLCDSFDHAIFRITLIDPSGKVIADSAEKADFLGSHIDREEVKTAFSGVPATLHRYSESLNQWMIYHAVPLKTESGTYVLRAAVSMDRIQRMLDLSKINMFWALLFGGEIVLLLLFYIIKRIRKPLFELQESVASIASGNLDSYIEIPENGIVRELALGVSKMTEQLKRQLMTITVERNEKNAILDNMSEAVLLFTSDDKLVHANHAAGMLWNLDKDGKFSLSRCQIPGLLELAYKTFSTGEPFEREFSLTQDGGPRSFFIKGRLLEEEGKDLLLLTVVELTNLRKLESFRSDFVANISHEIKTPLTCIVGVAEALEDDLPVDQRKKLLDILKQNSDRLNNLVHDILSLSALEKKQKDPSLEFVDVALDEVLKNAVDFCGENVMNSKMTLCITENSPLRIKGDAALLEQALINLIENAFKYSRGKNIEVSLKQSDKFAVFEVRDDGIGIPEEHQKRIFERFYRIDKSRSELGGGTGLGLAIVKHVAQMHRGNVELKSVSGKGCTFRILLPL